MATLMPEGKQSFSDSAGAPLVGGKVYTYDTGTTNPRATYQDAVGTIPNTNPIVLDARGEATIFWTGAYKIILKDSLDSTIWTVDNVVSSDVFPSSVAAPSGSSLVGFTQSGIGAINTTVQTALREIVSTSRFGTDPSYSSAVNSAAFNKAFAYMVLTGCELLIPPGSYSADALAVPSGGGNTLSNFKIHASGVTITGTTASAVFSIYRVQGLNINGLKVVKHASATYATVLDSFWFGNFTDCNFGQLKIASSVGWGVYWNEFNGSEITSLYIDVSVYTINHNIFKGGRVGTITKANFTAVPIEAYNNVFIGVDVLGPVIWTDTGSFASSFHDPLVFRDCNMEYAGQNQGYLLIEGGRNNLVGAYSAMDYSDLRSEMNMQYSGANWVTGWYPWSSVNLVRGGACQKISPDLTMIAVGNAALAPFADAASPTGNGYCYRAFIAGSSEARIRIRMPVEYLAAAKKVGFVSFSWWEYNTLGGGLIISNNFGTPGTGDNYPAGILPPGDASNTWTQRFVTVPVSSTATDVSLHVGGNVVTGFDVRLANVCCVLGKIARPYTPAQGDPAPNRGMVFSKVNLVQNGTAQNTFKLTIPATSSGRVRITAITSTANSGGIYEGELFYSSYSGTASSTTITANGVVGVGFGGTAGTITAMTASITAATEVTVTTTVANYSGTPTIAATYQLEFLDNNEVVTLL